MPAIARPLRRAPRVVTTVTGVAMMVGALAACSGEPSRDTQDYCAALAEQQSLLVMPVATADDVAPAVDRYLDMARRAPLVVQEPWRRLAALMQAAATIDISDAAARLDVIQQAYETEGDADLIVTHAQTACAITIDISGTTTTTTTTVTTTTVASVPVTEPTSTAPQATVTVPETPPATPTPAPAAIPASSPAASSG